MTLFNTATKGLLKPNTKTSNSVLIEFKNYTEAINVNLYDKILIINLDQLLPPHKYEESIYMLSILETIVYLDNNKLNIVEQNIIDHLINIERITNIPRNIIYAISSILNNFNYIKRQYSITIGSVLLGYEINNNSVYLWKF